MARDERPLAAVPRGVWFALFTALAIQVAWQSLQPRPVATAVALTSLPPVSLLRVLAGGEPIALAGVLTLYLQAFDDQPGISIPFRDFDYRRVIPWLTTLLELDPRTQYPLLLAAQVYSQVPDPARVRMMLDFIHTEFLRAPNQRWRWLAHACIMAKHQLHDNTLALGYARDIARLAPAAPDWAKQMHIFILEDLGQVESAKILLGGLLASGQIKDEHEMHFLLERLKAMENAEKSSSTSKN